VIVVGYENFAANQHSISNHDRLDGTDVDIVIDAYVLTKTDERTRCTLVAKSVDTKASACCQLAAKIDPTSAPDMRRPADEARSRKKESSCNHFRQEF
jgi:hypothetical protein